MLPNGGANDSGCIFSIDSNGKNYKILFDFTGKTGYYPSGSLIISGKVLYGMTGGEANYNYGCIFSIDTNGSGYKILLNFNDTNGAHPVGSLILTKNTSEYKLYGLTYEGGKYKLGCIFYIDTDGSGYKDMHDFNDTGGEAPFGDLTLSGSMLYGMTPGGGEFYDGVIFSIDTNGTKYSVLYNFKGSDSGAMPYGSLILNNNKLYGMTEYGGRYGNSDNDGNIFSINTNGSGYKDMYDFFGYPFDGQNPTGSLILSGGKLYGMSQGDLPYNNYGNIFSIDTNGSEYNTMFFFHDSNGGGPFGSLILIGNNLYGMTSVGGTVYGGVIFKIDTNYVNTTSINELTVSQGAINVYPNPASISFTVSLPQAVPASLEMYNELGQRVITNYELKITASTINVTALPDGVYFYRVVKEDGSLIGEGKEVIAR
jgi:uncharacterized repeat protein (TIGR03803 family)